MKRLKIGLDIDGVIVDNVQTMLPLLVEACNRPVTYNDLCHWDLAKALNIPEYKMNSVWAQLFTTTMLLDAPPVEGAIDALKMFNGHEIWIVTGRPSIIKNVTEAWFEYHAVKYNELIFTRPGSKLMVANGFDIFVDDFLDEAVSFARAGVNTLLYDRPWNQSEVLPESCRRVRDWETIVSLVKKLEENNN